VSFGHFGGGDGILAVGKWGVSFPRSIQQPAAKNNIYLVKLHGKR